MNARPKALLVLMVLALTTLGRAANFPELVAFGDSLSDMGNRWLSTNKTVTFRQTWVAQLTGPAMMNIPGFKPSGLSFFFGGANYAVGGAMTEYAARQASARNRGQNLTQQ
ncbi:MAG: SGNH/GDSL hydrolase family protein, partial [Kiritimatiellaeota bacterium]|nr:SGNH/GDSL hydrolase family protein [Kiritimatiellota bacterium]